jgi:hypothetical protein
MSYSLSVASPKNYQADLKHLLNQNPRDQRIDELVKAYVQHLMSQWHDPVAISKEMTFIAKVMELRASLKAVDALCEKIESVKEPILEKPENLLKKSIELPKDLLRKVTNFLSLQDRAALLRTSQGKRTLLEQTQAVPNLDAFNRLWKDLEWTYHKEAVILYQTTRHKWLHSPLLNLQEKQQLLNHRIAKILYACWQKEITLQEDLSIALVIASAAVTKTKNSVEHYYFMAMEDITYGSGSVEEVRYSRVNYLNCHLKPDLESKFGQLSDKLKSDKESMLKICQQNGWFIVLASEQLKKDPDLLLEAIKQDERAFCLAPIELRNNPQFVMQAVKQNPRVLQYVSAHLQGNFEIVLAAVKQDGHAFCWTSEELKNNRELALAAVRQNGWAIEYTKELHFDPEIALEAVKNDGTVLTKMGFLNKNLHIVLQAVKNNGLALQHASASLKNHREIVQAALKQNPLALQFASQEMKEDRSLVLQAIKQDGMALKWAGWQLKEDRALVLEAVKQNGLALEFASEDLKRDPEIVLEAVKQNGWALQFAPSLNDDATIISEAIKHTGLILDYASNRYKRDHNFLLRTARQNGNALRYAHLENNHDFQTAWAAIKNEGSALQWVKDVFGPALNVRAFRSQWEKKAWELINVGMDQYIDDHAKALNTEAALIAAEHIVSKQSDVSSKPYEPNHDEIDEVIQELYTQLDRE